MSGRLYDEQQMSEIRQQDLRFLIDNIEMYIMQEDFTHPGFFALLRDLRVPFNLMDSITRTAEKLKIPGCHRDFYAMLNRKIKERLYPLLVAYHRGLASEGDAVWNQQERDKRNKVVKSKMWQSKVQGVGKSDDEPTTDDQ